MSVINDDEQNRWRIKREISTGDIILAGTIIVAIGIPMLAWAVGINGRVSVLEDRMAVTVAQQQRTDAEQDQVLRDSVGRIESSIRDLQSYLLAHSSVQPH